MLKRLFVRVFSTIISSVTACHVCQSSFVDKLCVTTSQRAVLMSWRPGASQRPRSPVYFVDKSMQTPRPATPTAATQRAATPLGVPQHPRIWQEQVHGGKSPLKSISIAISGTSGTNSAVNSSSAYMVIKGGTCARQTTATAAIFKQEDVDRPFAQGTFRVAAKGTFLGEPSNGSSAAVAKFVQRLEAQTNLSPI